MQLIYVAGPFRADSLFDITINVSNAEYWGLQVAKHGHMPVVPHANSWKMYGAASESLSPMGTRLLLSVRHGCIFIPGWAESGGSLDEAALCKERKIPALDLDMYRRKEDALEDWLRANFPPPVAHADQARP